MGSSQNYGPLSVIGYLTAPNIEGYQNETLVLSTLLVLQNQNECHESFQKQNVELVFRSALTDVIGTSIEYGTRLRV